MLNRLGIGLLALAALAGTVPPLAMTRRREAEARLANVQPLRVNSWDVEREIIRAIENRESALLDDAARVELEANRTARAGDRRLWEGN